MGKFTRAHSLVNMRRRVISGAGIAVLTVAALASAALPADAAAVTARGVSTSPQAPRTPVPQSSNTSAHSKAAAKPSAHSSRAATAPKRGAGESAAELDAAVKAYDTGTSVPVAGDTTDTTSVLANPDGTFTMSSSTTPVNALVGGSWVPVNTALTKNADGTYSPAAAAYPVTFSGGGTAPMVTIYDPASSTSMSIGWPTALPAPTVAGSTATYPNVLPGVDLRLEATSSGYHEVLVVKSAAAAADPGLGSLTFALQASSGLSLSTDASGSVTATDTATGRTVFAGEQPVMWDSATTGPIHTAPSADNPGSGTVTAIPASDSGVTAPSRATVKTKASASIHAAAGGPALTVTLTPPAAALTGTKAAFPEFLDPNMTGGTQYYSEVMENGAPGSNSVGKSWHTGSGTSVGSGIVEVGYCGYSDCGDDWTGTYYLHYTTRTFYQLDTSPIQLRNGQEPNIYSAIFNVQEIGNSDGCVKQPVALWSAGPITSGTNWGNQPVNGNSELSEASSNAGGGSSCGGANVALDAGSWAQAAANGNWPNATFLLRAPDESNEYQYKTFSDSANLYVVYNFAPLAPTNLAVSNAVNCTGTVYTADAQPTLYATGHDNNPAPLNLGLLFEAWNGAGTTRESWNSTGVLALNSAANNANGSWTTSSSLPQGPNEFRVQGYNLVGSTGGNNLTGPWSAWYPFTEESVAPAQAPSVQSFDYPQGQWGQPQNTPGYFAIGANGSANIAGYAYSFDTGAGSEPVPSNTDCGYLTDGGLGNSIDSTLYGKSVPDYGNANGELANNPVTGTAQIRIPHNMSAGRHTLYVKAFNDAHTPSTEASYTFYVAPDYSGTYLPAGAAVDVVYGDTLAGTATPSGTVGTQVNNCCGAVWDDGNQLFFSNTTNGASFTTSFNVPANGTWELGLDMTVSFDYGQYRIDLDHATSGAGYGLDGTASSPFDGYNPSVSLKYLELGSPYLTAGTHHLTFTAVGKSAASGAYRLGIDYLAMSPTSRYDAAMLTTANSGTSGAGLGIQVLSNLWADNEQQYLTSTAVGAAMTLTFNAPVESDYALSLDLTKASNYGQVSVTLDPGSTNHTFAFGVDAGGNPIRYLDGYSANVLNSHQLLGGVHLSQGSHTLRFAVTGANSSSTGYSAGVAAIYAVPVTNAIESSFAAAMNNHGVASADNAATTANIDGVGDELSGPQLAVAGLAPGNTLTVNGAVYTMPAYRTDSAGNSYDNVVADGQTIPIPAIPTGQSVSGIGLLLVSTCGSSWPGNLTVNYQSGQPSQPALPVIPDWISGPVSSSSLRLTYRDENPNATPNTAKPVGIWAVTVPTTAGLVPTSITLPITTNSDAFLPGTGPSCADVMHVLAIGLETGSGSGPAAPTSTVGGTTYGTWDSAYAAPMDSATLLPTPSAGAASGITLTQVVTPSMIYPATTNYAYNDIRLHFTNNASASPVVLGSVTIAEQSSAGGANTTAAPVAVTFDANHYGTLTLTPGTSAWSNPIALPAGFTTGNSLVVSLYLPQTANTMPGWGTAARHTNPALTTLVSSGNTTTAQTAPTGTASVTGAFYLDQADVTDPTQSDGTIAILGDQSLLTTPVTATATPATTAEPAWEINLENDVLNNSELQTQTTSTNGTSMPGTIANESQNCLVLGTTGTACPNGETAAQLVTDRVSQLPGLRDVIISLGANDVADGASATTVETELSSLIQQIGGISNPNTATGKVQAIITTIPNPGNNPTINAINSWIGVTPGSTSSQDNFHVNVATAVGSDAAGSSQYYADWANAFTNGLAAIVPPSNQSFATHQ